MLLDTTLKLTLQLIKDYRIDNQWVLIPATNDNISNWLSSTAIILLIYSIVFHNTLNIKKNSSKLLFE